MQPHVEQRVGTILFVEVGSLIGCKSHVLVETYGVRVLLVHGELSHAEALDTVREEPPTKALSAHGRIEKKHLKATRLHAHEAYGRSIALGYDKLAHALDRLRDEGLNLGDLCI